MKVLLVDDNSDITTLLSEFLKEKGLDVHATNNAKEGLELIKTENFDCVVLDNDMPQIRGIEIIQELEKDGILKNQQIIILSGAGFTSEQINELTSMIGVKTHLRKPTYFEQIFMAITC